MAVGLYTGGLPQCRQSGSADIRTECLALWPQCDTQQDDMCVSAEQWDNSQEVTDSNNSACLFPLPVLVP